MSSAEVLTTFKSGCAQVEIYSSAAALGTAAAGAAAALMRQAIQQRGRIRVMVGTGNSQIPLVDALVKQAIDWKAVEVFHMDEYANIEETHLASFRFWIRTRLEEKVHPGKVHYIAGDARDLDSEIARYAELLAQEPIDLAFVGFGENGHIAFNDPHVADFDDPFRVKRVTLDEACRRQQIGEGHFKDLASVPPEAITVTCSELLRAKAWICCVPELRKANAVVNALQGPVSVHCPASVVQKHPNARVYLDRDSASLLT